MNSTSGKVDTEQFVHFKKYAVPKCKLRRKYWKLESKSFTKKSAAIFYTLWCQVCLFRSLNPRDQPSSALTLAAELAAGRPFTWEPRCRPSPPPSPPASPASGASSTDRGSLLFDVIFKRFVVCSKFVLKQEKSLLAYNSSGYHSNIRPNYGMVPSGIVGRREMWRLRNQKRFSWHRGQVWS